MAELDPILAKALADLPEIERRVAAGQMFNAYESGSFWLICIGPITDFGIVLVDELDWRAANLVIAALRAAFGQPQALFHAFDVDGIEEGNLE